MVAQRYPNDYDGILAIASAISYGELFGTLYWPQQVMNDIGSHPPQCEIAAVTAAAISACDDFDGIVDQSSASGNVASSTPSAWLDGRSNVMAPRVLFP
jgi:hypothetical protein